MIMNILKTCFMLCLLLLGSQVQGQSFHTCVETTISVVGSPETVLCRGDGENDQIRFRTRPLATPNAYIVVDLNDIIVHIGTSSTIDFESLPEGTLRVFSVSFIGLVIGEVGDNYRETLLGSYCSRPSSNFITISNLTPAAGQVTTAAGEAEITICINEGVNNVVDFITDSNFEPYLFVITDEENFILGTSADGTVDFTNAGIGICRVWGLAYLGNYTGQVGDNIMEGNLSDACYDLSAGYVEVTRLFPEAGTLAFDDGSDTFVSCSVLEPTGEVNVLLSGNNPGTASTYLLVDNATQTVAAVFTDPTLDLATLATGSYTIYHLAYTGNLSFGVGSAFDADALSDECADLSNALTLIKRVQNADDVRLADGSSDVTICVGDGIPDPLTFTSTYTGNDSFTYLITDESNFLLGISATATIDFEGAGVGVCRVWGLAYSGNLSVTIGENIGAPTLLSDECFDLSDGFVRVNRNGPDGGSIRFNDGSTSFVSCTALPPTGSITAAVTGNDPNSPFAFIVVNDADNTVAAILADGTVDLANVANGTYTIYGVSYTLGLQVAVGSAFDPTAVGTSCFDLSANTLQLIKRIQNADDVSLADGTREITICVGDGIPDELTFTSTYVGDDNFIYVITNPGNFVLGTSTTGIIDFEGADAGICRVWGLVYSGNLTFAEGDNLNDGQDLADECYDLSDNFVIVNRNGPNAGNISLEGGATSYTECLGGANTVLAFTATGAVANLAYTYLVVNTSTDEIVAILTEPSLDLSTLPLGTYDVYGLSYLNNLSVAVGDNFSGAQLADVCFDLSDNSIRLVNRNVAVNEITFTDGSTLAAICPDASVGNILNFTTDYTGSENVAYLVTTTDNTIIQILAGTSTDFSAYSGDFVRVWAVAFSGNFLLQTGETIVAGTQISDECFDLSDNFLLVDLRGPDGGTLSLADGSTETGVCVSDGVADLVNVQTTSAGGTAYIYVITDENNIILNTSSSAEIDFETAPAGTCRIWGLAYRGTLQAVVGDDAAATELASECFDLSDNFIVVVRTFVDGGTVSLEDGTTASFACSGDGIPDFFTFITTSTAAAISYGYIVTDAQNNILGVLAGNSVDLDQAAAGQSRVWGFSYTGNITAETGDNAATVALTDGCYELSTNFVTIQRDRVVGGTVSLADGNSIINICPNDGNPDELSFINTGMTTGNYTYILTDVNNNVLSAFAAGTLDFDDIIAPAEVRVWGLAYSGLASISAGNINVSAVSNRCYDLSTNFVTIIREAPAGGTVATTAGQTSLYLCTDDGLDDIYSFAASGASNTDYVFVITDDNNNILDLLTNTNTTNFEGAPNGTCRVWGLAFTGTLLAQVGDNAATATLSDDCYNLTSNYVTVVRGELNAGTVSTVLGTGDRFTCPGDGMPDVIRFDSLGVGSGTYAYVLTDDQNSIVAFPATDAVDFETLPQGIYRLWGFVFTGDLLATIGTDAGTETLATDCYDLSDNFITVINVAPVAGTITTSDGAEAVAICIGDGIADPFSVVVTGASAAAYTYLIVEEDSTLVGTLNDPTFNFEAAAPGDWRIYGLSYTGSLSVLPGANIFTDQLASGCYNLTSNYVFVDKTEVDGGEIFTDDGRQVVYTCMDGVPDIINFVNSSASTEATYRYVLTNQGNIVLQVLTGNSIDFEAAAGLSALRIWGVSFTGNLTLSIGNNITQVALSTGCNVLSENYVDVFLGQPDGGTLSLDNGDDSLRLCHSNFMPGVHVNTTSTSNLGYAYLLTDTANVVLEVSEPADDVVSFDNVVPGTYRVWAVSYAGNLLVEAGDTASVVALASSCFELSDNFLTIERTESLDAGQIATMRELDVIYVCIGDNVPDIVILSTTSDDDNYRYIITDDQNRILFGDIESNIIDFDVATPGICRIYGVSYTGEFMAPFMFDATTAALSSDCWALSDNYITLIRQNPVGGTVSTSTGETTLDITVGDGLPDVVTMTRSTTAPLTPYVYVITNTDNVILGISADGIIDFEGAGEGVCRVWGLSYTGNITANIGDDADEVALTDDCYDLSGNFVTVNRTSDGNLVPGNGNGSLLGTAPVVTLTLYPNPAIDQLQVQLQMPEAALTNQQMVEVFNLNGMSVLQRNLTPVAGVGTMQLDISQLQTGMYLLRWSDGAQVILTRFIKQ
ncbi:MAG: hypothetical protein DA408_07245 [Bacteroidetes bacterium]|nr:MAG: hypothetical protein DA408_07245 [Bacteroidota bacterium]